MIMESLLDTPFQTVKIATKIQVSVYEFVLFKRIKLSVKLCDNNGQVIDTKLFSLENDDYTNWEANYKGNDQYIIDWVKIKLNEESNNN